MSILGARKINVMESDTIAEGSVISFHDINYVVETRKFPFSKPTKKVVLENMTGCFKPGLNAILGPTGGGKSSLLDVLAGRKEKTGLTGNILIDGLEQPDNFKCMSGYVVQDDIIMGTLTVRENLMFSANLRLPKTTPDKQKAERVNGVMEDLNITHVADSKVGTQFTRGISGGERKRTNIGMELIVNSSILFLDEPTTGLDASTANTVLELLHNISRKGKTIIFSIHQPRFSIFKLFDRMMLLSKGLPVYHGPSSEAALYFADIGYQCEPMNNPPDFFLDVIIGDSTTVSSVENGSAVASGTSKDPEAVTVDYRARSIIFNNKYLNSTWAQKVREETSDIFTEYKKKKDSGQKTKLQSIDFATGFLTQIYYLSQRALKNVVRDLAAAVMQMVVMTIFALLIGAIFFDLPKDEVKGVQNRVGAFFFFVMTQAFINFSAIEIFIRERVIFQHENVSGFYRTSSYFLSKVFCDLLPLRALPLIVFALIVYYMLGLEDTAGKFFFFLLTLYLTSVSCCAICLAMSATFETLAIANIATSLIFVIMTLFSGMLANIESIADWLEWLKYFSLMRFCLQGLLINEFEGQYYTKNENGTDVLTKAGESYLKEQEIDFGTDWNRWVNIVALASISVGYFTIGYIQLRRMKKLK
ncbi:DgyrCDS7101 [Dimorphilus gyrociliatus]|uniref:DgyrCDS7101 n=1 Tax=Dimorphilus gyrociliatus TaxID=2664684 RepID=A0A7I8VSQ4_9ANNE|nr:DgyrCDS7101 [Dimorphilus gyrociliatus]